VLNRSQQLASPDRQSFSGQYAYCQRFYHPGMSLKSCSSDDSCVVGCGSSSLQMVTQTCSCRAGVQPSRNGVVVYIYVDTMSVNSAEPG
jgi:hypothetical protein